MLRKILLAALAVFSIPALAQEDLGKKGNASINEVANSIYLYKNRGGNILIAEAKDDILVVDTQYEDLADELLDEIRKIAEKKQIAFVINTNHDSDNTGANAQLTQQGAVIVAHENTRKRLMQIMQEAENNRRKVDEKLLPAITFSQDMTFHFNGQEVLLKALPGGHTDGDVIVFFKGSNVIHTGDVFLNGKYPYFDTASGGSVKGLQEGLAAILNMIDDNTRVIPGHGAMCSKPDVLYFQNMLNRVYKRVRLEYLKKKSLEEIQAMTDITAEFDKRGFGDGNTSREQFIESLVNDLKQDYDFDEIERQKERFKEAQKRANLLNAKNKGGGRR